jgi:hypothetical protein
MGVSVPCVRMAAVTVAVDFAVTGFVVMIAVRMLTAMGVLAAVIMVMVVLPSKTVSDRILSVPIVHPPDVP